MKTAYAKAKAAGASEEDIHLMLESMAKSSGITPGEGSIVKVPLEDGRTWTLAVRGKAPNGGTPGRDVELSQPDWLEHVPFPKQGENFPKSPEMGQMDTLVSYGDDSKKSTSDAISNLTGNDKAEVSPEGLKAKDPRKIVQDGPSVSVPLASGGSAKLFLGAKVRGKFYRGTGNAAETEQNHVIVPMRVVESHADGSLSARVLETSQIRLSNNGLKEPLYLQKGTLLRIGKGHDMGFDNIVSMETHLQEYHPKYNKNPKMTTLFDAPTKGVSESLPKAKGGAKLLSDKLKAMPGEEASSISDAGKRISYSSEKLRAAMEELDRLKKEGC